jgi:hypothetical protein
MPTTTPSLIKVRAVRKWRGADAGFWYVLDVCDPRQIAGNDHLLRGMPLGRTRAEAAEAIARGNVQRVELGLRAFELVG